MTEVPGTCGGAPSLTAEETVAEPAQPKCPVWLDLFLVIAISAVISFGGFGLLLADLGHYSAPVVFVVGAVGTVLGTAVGRPRAAERSPLRRGHTIPAIGACLVALGQMIWNAVHVTHHVTSGMDPGVYLLTGKWVAQHGNLTVPAASVWSGKGSSVQLASSGMYLMKNGTLQFQFAHMMGVLLAEGNNLGGDALMFRVPAVLGAIGLCAVYAVGCRLVHRPWLVLAAVFGLAVCLPELNVTREDSFSEPSTQVLLWGAILLILRAYTVRSAWIAFLAGLAIGGTLMTHIDAAIYLVPLPPLAALALIASKDRGDVRAVARLVGFGFLGVIPPAILGTVDVQYRAGTYYDDLSGHMHALYKLLTLSTVLSVVVVLGWWTLPALAGKVSSVGSTYRQVTSVVAAWVVVVGLVLAWLVRPLVAVKGNIGFSAEIAQLQKAYQLASQADRTYSEQTLRWFDWYIGPVALALAVIGLGILVFWAIRYSSVVSILLLTMVGGISVLYLWNPQVNPVQIWATRRFATAAFPLFMLAAALAIDFGATAIGRHVAGRIWPRTVMVVAAAGIVALPLVTTWPVRSFSSQANWSELIKDTCQYIGPDAAVLIPPTEYSVNLLPMTYEDFCNVPVATMAGPESAAQLSNTAEQFRQEGRTLWILGPSPQAITAAAPGVTVTSIGTSVSPHELVVTLVKPPQSYASATLAIYAARVS